MRAVSRRGYGRRGSWRFGAGIGGGGRRLGGVVWIGRGIALLGVVGGPLVIVTNGDGACTKLWLCQRL